MSEVSVDKQIKLVWCGAMLVISSVWVSLGIFMIFYSMQGYREEKLHIYQIVIDEWNLHRRPEFDMINIKIFHNDTESEEFSKWENEDLNDLANHDAYGDLPQYDRLQYHLNQLASEIGFSNSYS